MTDPDEVTFWMVMDLSPGGQPPAKRHYQLDLAVAEATRLARKHGGTSFGILTLTAVLRAEPAKVNVFPPTPTEVSSSPSHKG